jgi:hypothetical protein
MPTIPVCDGVIQTVGGPAAPFQCFELDGVTPKAFTFIDYEPVDFSALAELLTFDYSTFSLLLGTCIVLFITGHSAGHVARNLGRV